MMKLTDYVIDVLAKAGVKHVFGLTGGAAVHLFDSVSKHKDMEAVFTHHEQAAAMAAEMYSRITNNLGAAIFTTGPGGTNAITGVTAAWLDSIPCIYISGQARLEHTTYNKPIRQIGSQQLHIIPLVAPITKYAVMITDPLDIRYHLEKAIYLAKTGRPGPVWIDIPLNFQWMQIEPQNLKGFNPDEIKTNIDQAGLDKKISQAFEMLQAAKRPVILAGYGIRLAHAEEKFRKMAELLKIPVVTSWTASDIFDNNDPIYFGRIGMSGQRGANILIQNSDLVLAVGSHLAVPMTGTNSKAFARAAKKIVVDLDSAELDNLYNPADLKICTNVNYFIDSFSALAKNSKLPDVKSWRDKASIYRAYNRIPKALAKKKKPVNSYVFVDALSDMLKTGDVVVSDGGGTVIYTAFQSFRVKKGQRLAASSGICSMGTGLPESIGACFANKKKRTICFIGDGSMQFNIQELETIKYHKLPLKIFIFNNDGYLAIRHTQQDFLNRRFIGSEAKGGLSLPDFLKVAKAYGIKSVRIKDHRQMRLLLPKILKYNGPIVCDLVLSRTQEVIPRVGFDRNPDGTARSRPLEDMYPYLSRKEFSQNMFIEPL